MTAQLNENTQYVDDNGTPINNGYVYIGVRNQDPVANPQTIYSDRDFQTTLTNPQRTGSDGRVLNKIFINGRYSIKVENSANVQQILDLDAGEASNTGISALTNVVGVDAIVAEGAPFIPGLTDGQIYTFKAAGTNTGAVTLAIDGQAAKAIKKQHDIALAANDFEANMIVSVAYNSTDDTFELISNVLVDPYIYKFDVLTDMTAAVSTFVVGDRIDIIERISGQGGGGTWHVVDATTVTENEYNIVTGDATRSFQLQTTDTLNPLQWGADNTGVVDSAPIFNAMIATLTGGGRIEVPPGDYLWNSTVTLTTTPNDVGGLELVGIGSISEYTRFNIDHVAGPGLRVARKGCTLKSFAVAGTGTRSTQAYATGDNNLDTGILFEGEATDNYSISRQRVIGVTSRNHSGHGIAVIGLASYSRFEQIITSNNKGHGFAIDDGNLTSRTFKDQASSIYIANLASLSNGGHGLAIGNPDISNTADMPIKITVYDYDSQANATDSGVRYTAHDSYVFGENHTFQNCAFDCAVGAAQVMGRNIHFNNTRLVGSLTAGIKVFDHVTSGVNSSGVLINGVRSLTTADLDPAVEITQTTTNYSLGTEVFGRTANNITNLVDDQGKNSVIHEIIPALETRTALYDFAVHGGTFGGTIAIGKISDNASIIRAWYEVITAPASAGAADIYFSVDVDDSSGLLAATAYNNAAFAVGYHEFIQTGTTANMTTKTTNVRDITIGINNADLTAGKIRIWYQYVTSE